MLPTRARTASQPIWDIPFDWVNGEFDRMLGKTNSDTIATTAYPVDIHEDDEHIYVDAELPGFTRNQVEVTFENRVLSITAERKVDESRKGRRHLSERRFTGVARSFTLPATIDDGKVDAKLADGVLHLTLHKREEVKPRRIEVN